MKNLFIPLLIVVLLLSANLGLVVMNHIDGQGHAICPLESAGMANCNQTQSPLDFIVSHLNAFSTFFSAILTNNLLLIASVFLLVLAVSLYVYKSLELFPPGFLLFKNHFDEPLVSPRAQQLRHWFCLHENSPTTS